MNAIFKEVFLHISFVNDDINARPTPCCDTIVEDLIHIV